MLSKICAVIMLVLAVCPLTAPFQTFGSDAFGQTRTAHVDAIHAAVDPGSLIGPVQTRHDRVQFVHVAVIATWRATVNIRGIVSLVSALADSGRQLSPDLIFGIVLRV